MINCTAVCPECATGGVHQNIQWSEESGYHCPAGHRFEQLPAESSGSPKSVEAPPPGESPERSGSDAAASPSGGSIPLPETKKFEAQSARASEGGSTHTERVGESTSTSKSGSSPEDPPADIQEHRLEAHPESQYVGPESEQILPTGDVLLGIKISVDHIGHLRSEAETQGISVAQYIQNYVTRATQEGWI